MSRPTFNLGLFLEKEKLKTNGSNFMSWFRNLRILLTPHKVAYVIEAALGDPPADDASEDDKKVYQTKSEDSSFVQSGMLYAMEADLQKRFEKMSAFEIISDLKAVFAPQAKAERYEASELFFSAKMDERMTSLHPCFSVDPKLLADSFGYHHPAISDRGRRTCLGDNNITAGGPLQPGLLLGCLGVDGLCNHHRRRFLGPRLLRRS